MSMLTPPGMGGQYRITGDKYPRMRRNRGRRLVLAVVASVAALGLVGWGTLQLIDVFTGGGDKASAAAAAAGCGRSPSPSASPVKAVPEPGQITVNVLNATSRTGLAKNTADALKKRGFRIGEVGNASKAYDKKVEGPGVVLGAKAAADTALTVLATQVTGAEKKTDSRVKPAEVDLILGKAFKALAPEKAAARALTVLSDPAPAPSPRKRNC
ncbi:LytR C-terminal domain-containing protein [Streptomyces beigongshangae]|uniref:LytR C-terminal domain-containing protein n=1 Tax=Streptomyces beigongshangae TaxID=2841597 RepID=UPI0021A4EF1A|nr:LytR C-terminal domain-containing protein [Streptomyces sp. REN17]